MGAAAQVLNPGSHWYQPGKTAHGDECLSDQCLLLIQMEGPYDFAVAPETPSRTAGGGDVRHRHESYRSASGVTIRFLK